MFEDTLGKFILTQTYSCYRYHYDYVDRLGMKEYRAEDNKLKSDVLILC